MSLPCILDVNEFWSPSGGGVRRYHLQKMAYFRDRTDVRHVMVMPGPERRTEQTGPNAFIEHVPAFKFPGNWEYRVCPSAAVLREVFRKHRPDVIEIGSPYLLPGRVCSALRGTGLRPKRVGFWHADFPVTYVERFFGRFGKTAARAAAAAAWAFARRQYARPDTGMDAVFVPSEVILHRVERHGLRNLHHMPLGVDAEMFHPGQRDAARALELKAGVPERLTVFFGHRFCEEKGLRTLLAAYPALCARLGHEPAVVFAGTGPDLDRVRDAAGRWPHVRYIGFVRSPEEMAAWYASCDMGLALSGWETFGLSIVEALACGQVLVAADQGAAREHAERSGAGVTVPVADTAALVDAIDTLWREKTLHADAWAERSRKAVAYAQRLTWDACFDREMEVYREIAMEHQNSDIRNQNERAP